MVDRSREETVELEDGERYDRLLPELVEVIGNVKSATASELAKILENEKDIRASAKAVERALQSGCKLNIIQECRQYTVNKDFYMSEDRGMDMDEYS